MNTINLIYPYRHEGLWVFDDHRFGFVGEPFVRGADLMINDMVQHFLDAENGFRLIFSELAFPGFQLKLKKGEAEHGGCWYRLDGANQEGWLCPVLYCYFDSAPEQLFTAFVSRLNH